MKTRVAMVDNHESIMMGWKVNLQEHRKNTEVVFTSTSLLTTISLFGKNTVDILLLDYLLHKNHGINETVDFLRHAKKTQPRCKIMLITSVAPQSTIRILLEEGADYVHIKGTVKAFLDSFDKTLAGEKPSFFEVEMPSFVAELTSLEKKALQNCNLTNEEIAILMKKGLSTVERYFTIIYQKSGLKDRKQLYHFYKEHEHLF